MYMNACLPQQACQISGQCERVESPFLAGGFREIGLRSSGFVCVFLRQGFSVAVDVLELTLYTTVASDS